ncbi:hypothetical protein CJ739_508 [Mariniflexile rhizosphaerae]|uniref:hypothetical protein n=1 Tax=unclassified Mariniflexile TaxID=2643887 RepID=UPI000CAADC24|nr:hypothetical protein [Mariniflexile sp. TRM1-10]AXP79606.1 hypothetical protein CJ739_508 [Mariniflexile sp. TRM1-10]PLB18559.1 MAG: hypothetical protein TRG1_2544 [Flavobacteriaceae bacterium FS1-H7996/R]
MKLKYFAILVTCLLSTSIFSQANLNNYKYVIIPNKYDFLKEADQYQLNSLTEFLFDKYGFQTLMEGSNYPEDVIRNRCLALKSNVIKDSGLFKTKLTVELKNCNDQVVYTSEMGESREKEYQKAYNEALRDAFKSIEALNYKYVPNTNNSIAVSQNVENESEVSKEIQQLREEIQNLKKEKEAVVSDKVEPKVDAVAEPIVKEAPSGVLYAQAIENGFQLVDSTPKVVYKIKKTSIDGVFLVENKNATLYKKDANWILEYYENNVLKQDVLNIKF